ncbi:AAA family ATPase [Sulfurovum sp. NBC37-1]|uniref:AAA family ATPase n=1 Tax=Sulfurovum sp. (strain NBC37-1) TaxID=387093 RepID=UPI00031D323C|nr:SMC family ATPase [Sulfurovum sp. NBC37-1]
MMILTSLHMQNYKKYRDFSLDFAEGLTGIIGRNGSGKSTIFDAITFALYGDVRGEKETIRYAKADVKEPVKVTLEFEIDGESYKVVREMRGKALVAKAYLYDGDDVLLAESAKGVTGEIIRLIGMTKEAFMHTVFASQKELTALSGLKNEDRKKIIRKLLGLEKIDKIETDIKMKLRVLKNEIEAVSGVLLSGEEVRRLEEEKERLTKALGALQKEVAEIEKKFQAKSRELDALDKTLKALQKLKEDFAKLNSDLALLQKGLEDQKSNLQKGQKGLKELQTKASQYEKEKHLIDEYKALAGTIAKLQKQKELLLKKEGLEKEQVALREQYENAKKEIQALRKKLEAKPELLKEQAEKNRLLQASAQKLKEIEAAESRLREEIAKYNGLIENTNKQVARIESIGKGSDCPTCTRPLLDEYDNVIATLKETIEKLHNEEIAKREHELKAVVDAKAKEQETKTKLEQSLQKLSGDLRVLEADEKTLADKEEEFKKITAKGLSNKQALEALKDVKYDEEAHKEALAKKEKLESKYKELIGLSTLIAQIPALENELKAIASGITQSEEKIKKQEKAIAAHSYDAKEHEKQSELYAKVSKEKDDLAKALSDERVKLKGIEGEIKTLQSKLARNEEQKKQLQVKLDDKSDYDKLKAFMGEFKNKINSQISPRISQLASEMYATITRGKYQHIEVSDEFDFFIYDDGVKYPIERFSGGEVDLANLVLRIAISKTLSELSGSGGVGFLAFDEVFGSQDEERRFEIMEAFHTIKEQYRQIFLISHESEIKEMFERVVEL